MELRGEWPGLGHEVALLALQRTVTSEKGVVSYPLT